jgi:hypothetical protein
MTDDLAIRVELLEKQLLLIENYSVEAFWRTIDRIYSANLPNREIGCIVCDYRDKRGGFEIHLSQCIFRGGELERYKCPQCECIFGALKYLDLDETFVNLDYRFLYSRYSESDSTCNEIRTFNSLRPEKSGLYLNWGCGGAWSRTISQLRNDSWDVWGYEPSAEASGEFVVNQRGAIGANFDGIFSNNVIEHFRDPVGQFHDFHKILKPNGRMAHSTPCYEYSYEFTRFHTLFLIGKSPEILAERTGFQVADRVQDGEYISLVFSKRGDPQVLSQQANSPTYPTAMAQQC